MGSVAFWLKLRNCKLHSSMERRSVPEQTHHNKGGSSEQHKGGGKGEHATAFDVGACKYWPPRKGSCTGDPLAKNKQCQCLCETSAEGAAKRCRHKPRRRHECSECHTLVCTGYCWIEHLQMCHRCREEQLFVHLCSRCALARTDLAGESSWSSADEFLAERRHTLQAKQMRHGAVLAAGAGVSRGGFNDLEVTPCPECAAMTEMKP